MSALSKVNHRLFSHITMNWRGRLLVSHDVIVNLIWATRTASGLRVKARLDKDSNGAGFGVLPLSGER